VTSVGGSTHGRVGAVVLAFGEEPLLQRCVHALLGSRGVDVRVVVVDNGSRGAVDAVRDLPRVEVLTPGTNLGFAGGCNLGASALPADRDTLVLVNSDAVVRPDALAALHETLTDPTVGIATGSLRLMAQPETVNSVGNPVHFSGISWAGGLGEHADQHAVAGPVTSASGAILGTRVETWRELGGFWEPMFAYCEDLELSLRSWQRGGSVVYVPTAVAEHDYRFHRNATKMYLVERNRLAVLATLYEWRTLVVLGPALVALELALLALSVRQGWWRDKLRGYGWLVRHAGDIRRRRRWVAGQRTVRDRDLLGLFTDRIEPGEQSGMSAPALLNSLSAAYWHSARRLLGRAPRVEAPAPHAGDVVPVRA